MSSDKLTRQVQAGEIIKPWLILGPFYEDLSAQVVGLTFFEKPGATVGRAAMAEKVGAAIDNYFAKRMARMPY